LQCTGADGGIILILNVGSGMEAWNGLTALRIETGGRIFGKRQ